MKNISNIVGLVGVAVLVYAIVGRFIGGHTLGLGFVSIIASSGLLIANSLILVAIFLRLWEK